MNEKNKNYQRIDKLIVDSFIYLCKVESTNNISVSMLCKKADINRTTFYNHYKDIWEIIEVIEKEIIAKINNILDDFNFYDFMKNPYDTLSKFNAIIEKKPNYYKKLFELSESRFFIDKLKDIFRNKILEDKGFTTTFNKPGNAQGIISFFVGGLANVYSDWFDNKINCTLDELIKQMSESLIKYLSTI